LTSYTVGIISPTLGWGTTQLLQSAAKYGRAVYISPGELVSAFLADSRTNYQQVDAIIVKGFLDLLESDPIILKALIWLSDQAFFINTPEALFYSSSKIVSTSILAQYGFLVPRTLVTSDVRCAVDFIQRVHTVISKPDRAKGGRGQLLFQADTAGLGDRLLALPAPYYLQEYLPHTRDLRVFVIGGDIAGVLYRYRQTEDWRTNRSQPIQVEPGVASPQLKQLALAIVNLFDLGVTALDLIEAGKQAYYMVDINGCPGWALFQTYMPDLDIPALQIHYIYDKLSKGAFE